MVTVTVHKHRLGAATLVTSVVLMVSSSIILIFAANYGAMQDKTTANRTRNQQAFQAAEAGLEYGINYLQKNRTTILANPVGGYIPAYSDSNTNNVALANSSRYTISYSNPVANNYNLIQITSTGTSSDGTATRVVSQRVQYGSLLGAAPTKSLSTKGAVKLKSDAVITNTSTNSNIAAASTITILDDAYTATSSGTRSTKNGLQSDVQQNSSSLASMSQSNFIASYFTTGNVNTIKSQAAYSYTNSNTTDYSSQLNGLSGTSIFIDQSGGKAKIKENTVIGSVTNPVLLIIDGKAKITGNTIIYGFVFVLDGSDDDDGEDSDGEGTISKNAQIIGGMATSDNTKITKNAHLTYNATVLNNLQNQSSMHYFAKVPGSWKDY